MERLLYGRSAGRCQFRGCNRFLLEHHVTHSPGNFAEKAHIVAFSIKGPRGVDVCNREEINSIENLMLLCPGCHKQIDDDPNLYTIEMLRQFKREHEERIFRYTEFKPENSTRVLKLVAQVRGQRSAIPEDAIKMALSSTNYDPREGLPLDLNVLSDTGGTSYWELAAQEISKRVIEFLRSPISDERFQPISVFAMARIPLLIHLGSVLSSKVPARVFNRHLVADDWQWQNNDVREFVFKWKRKTSKPGVVLVLSLSGAIDMTQLPPDIIDAGSIGEISPRDGSPSRTCLESEASVESFRRCYLAALVEVAARDANEIALVPAVPIAAAIHIGRDLLPKTHPPVQVYDWNGKDGYEFALEVNSYD